MSATKQQLKESLSALHDYLSGHKHNPVIHGEDDLGMTHMERLIESGHLLPITDNWYYVSRPERGDDPSDWYKAYWFFIAAYLDYKYGNRWTLGSDDTLLFRAGEGVIPKQLTVRSCHAKNSILELPFGLQLLEVWGEMPEILEREERFGISLFPLHWALLTASPGFYRQHPMEARTCVAMVNDTGGLALLARTEGFRNGAVRVAGAFRSMGNQWYSDAIMHSLGFEVGTVPENPFREDITLPYNRTAITSRIRLMWMKMREVVLYYEELIMPTPRDLAIGEIMTMTEDVFVRDTVNSLGIDGYKVSEELAGKVQYGRWDADTHARESEMVDACAAQGYADAFCLVRSHLLSSLTGGCDIAEIVVRVSSWHQWLITPSFKAGVMLWGHLERPYRDAQCYVRRSRHIPVEHGDIEAALDMLQKLMSEEPDAFVRAVLGHFFLVYIHPFMEGNGQVARFLMNCQLIAGGYAWTVIPAEKAEEYDEALEEACTRLDISKFARLVANLVVAEVRENP